MSREKKALLVSRMTEIAAEATGLAPESIYVFIKENEPDNVGVGGVLLTDLHKK